MDHASEFQRLADETQPNDDAPASWRAPWKRLKSYLKMWREETRAQRKLRRAERAAEDWRLERELPRVDDYTTMDRCAQITVIARAELYNQRSASWITLSAGGASAAAPLLALFAFAAIALPKQGILERADSWWSVAMGAVAVLAFMALAAYSVAMVLAVQRTGAAYMLTEYRLRLKARKTTCS